MGPKCILHTRRIHLPLGESSTGSSIGLKVKNSETCSFRSSPLPACCGGGGPYNYNFSLQCGNWGSNVCADPSRYITWDGMHLTEAAYRKIAIGILTGPNAVPPILNTCPRTEQKVSGPQYVLLDDDVLDG